MKKFNLFNPIIGVAQKPANFALIFLKAILLFALTLLIAYNPEIQKLYLNFLDMIYGNGFLAIILMLIIITIIMAALITASLKMVLSSNKLFQLIGILLIVLIEGFYLSFWVAFGSMFEINNFNVANLAIIITLSLVVVNLILSNFIKFNQKAAGTMLLIIISVSVISFFIFLFGFLVPGLHEFLFNIFYISPIAILISLFLIGFLSYALIGIFGFLKNAIKENKIDRKNEWYIAVVINYLIVKIYEEIVKLLIKIAIRRNN